MKPMKQPSKLKAVYLEEIKRTSRGRPADDRPREFWQGIGSKSQRAFEETA